MTILPIYTYLWIVLLNVIFLLGPFISCNTSWKGLEVDVVAVLVLRTKVKALNMTTRNGTCGSIIMMQLMNNS